MAALKVRIEITGDALKDEHGEPVDAEVTRILRNVATTIDMHGVVRGDEFALQDLNGNTVGWVKVTKR